MANGREWSTWELRYLHQHYPAGTPVAQIAAHLDRTIPAVKRKAQQYGLVSPDRSSQQRIRNFETAHGKPLLVIAREYRDRNLSRRTLAHDIGIERLALYSALGEVLWHSWPWMTIGRVDEARQRRKTTGASSK